MSYYDDDREIRDPGFCAELAAMDHRPELIIELPLVLSDEAARLFYGFLQELADKFYDHYAKQIERAHRARQREQEEFLREQGFQEPQMELPFDDPDIDDPF
jgi:hypothetical protein